MRFVRFFLLTLLAMLLIGASVSVQAAESDLQLEITSLPDKLVYGLGENLDKTGLEATLWNTQSVGTVYEASDLSVSYNFSTAGKQIVTVKARDEESYKWYSAAFTAYVLPYTRTLQDSTGYPRNTYYGYDLEKSDSLRTYACPGAKGLLLQFSEQTNMDCADYIYLADGNGTLLGQYEDDELSGKKIWIEGSSFSIWITSDEDDCHNSRSYGYTFDAIYAVNAASCTHLYGDETVTPATCSDDGSRVKECVGCGYVSTTVLPKLTANGKHTYNYEEDPQERFIDAYNSYYDMYYSCKTCGYENVASGYPGWNGNDANHGNCGNWLRWALFADGTMVIYTVYDYQSAYTMWSIPEKASKAVSVYVQNLVTNIYPEAFRDADKLTSVHLPATIQTIDDAAFYDCDALTEVSFPSGLTTIGDEAFRHCDNLTSVDFGASSPTVGEYAFYYCQNLSSVNFGTGAVSVGYSAFDECSSIKTLDIPARVTLDRYAFHKCTGLTNVTVRTADIPDSCFESCWSLSSVTLENTRSIGEYAFGGTSKLYSIVFPTTLESIDRAFTAQANHTPALRTATFLSKDLVFTEHPFPSVSTAQLTIRGPGCSTAAAFAKSKGYAFSATDDSSHSLQVTPAVLPTCQTEGFTEGEVCTACGYVAKVRTSLGMGEHEITDWTKYDDNSHVRGCLNCNDCSETEPHSRKVGYCSKCEDDSLSFVLSDGTLTLFCPQGGFEGLTVACAVYRSGGQMRFCIMDTWNEGPVKTLPVSPAEETDTISIYFLLDNAPLRPSVSR